MTEIKLPSEKEITTVPAQTVLTDCILVSQVTDNGTNVVALITPIPKEAKALHLHERIHITLVLWEGDAYKDIGQWTDSDVETRIKELI